MNTAVIESRIGAAASAARPFFTRLAALGFALIALAALVALGFGLAAGSTGELAFILPVVIVALLISGALLRFGVWAQVLAALLSLALLALVLPFSIFNLLHLESGGDFIPIVLVIAGAGFGLCGSVAGLWQRRRHTLRVTATRTETLAVQAILSAVALRAVASLLLTAAARTAVSAQSKAGAIAVQQKDSHFGPDRIQVKTGQPVRVVVRNDDTTLHTFTLDEAGVDVSIPPGAERLVEFNAPSVGSYRWYCIPHSETGPAGRAGMVGTLVVQ
jgi:plastocyanin